MSGTNVNSHESDSEAGPSAAGSYFSLPQITASPQPPLSVIAERRSTFGEESDEDEEEESEWRPGSLHDNEANDESVVKSGYLWKKGERRKVSRMALTMVGIIYVRIIRRGKSAGLSSAPLNSLIIRMSENISASIYFTSEIFIPSRLFPLSATSTPLALLPPHGPSTSKRPVRRNAMIG